MLHVCPTFKFGTVSNLLQSVDSHGIYKIKYMMMYSPTSSKSEDQPRRGL